MRCDSEEFIKMLIIDRLLARYEDLAALARAHDPFGCDVHPVGSVAIEVMKHEKVRKPVRDPVIEMGSLGLVVPPARELPTLVMKLLLEP